MKRLVIAAAALALALVIAMVALWAGRGAATSRPAPTALDAPSGAPSAPPASAAGGDARGFLHGRISTLEGAVYEGRLRWGGVEEAFWTDAFNGVKAKNPWLAQVPAETLSETRRLELFGLEIASWERQADLTKPFMARFGDIASIEAHAREIRVTLKSGREVALDRFAGDDLADGLRIWDRRRGVVDLDEWAIRRVELFAAQDPPALSPRLWGRVRTGVGTFRGFLQWDRQARVGSDLLAGEGPEGELRLRFDTIRSIAREGEGGRVRVGLSDGRELELKTTLHPSGFHRGVTLDDPRFGRAYLPWRVVEAIDFEPAPSGPGYDDFPPGEALSGSVTTREGRRLEGRLVFDLDESETSETLDAPLEGVSYMIPFGLIASIELPMAERARESLAEVRLHDGETMRLEKAGDLGAKNSGLLVLAGDDDAASFIPWAQVARIELSRPAAMYPPFSSSARAGSSGIDESVSSAGGPSRTRRDKEKP